MKKKLFSLLMAALLMLALSATAFADPIPAADGWQVTYTADNKMESNFSSDAIADTLSNLQPGDDTTFTVTVKNASNTTVDWYMLNHILDSLEDTSSYGAVNGGYTYILNYTTSGGSVRELYSSNRVGGGGQDGYITPAGEGLNEIDDALKSYMFLERMASGGSGTVTLYVALDGESQDNAYMNSAAELQMRFAVEVVETDIVVTGDESASRSLSPVYIGMGVSGLVILVLGIDGLVRNLRRNRKERNA